MRPLIWALGAYGVLSLISMATMGIGAALLAAATIYYLGGPAGFWKEVNKAFRHPAYLLYAQVALALLAALALSLVGAELFPLSYGGQWSHVNFLRDISKAWYLLWPLFIVPALIAVGADGQKKVLRAWLIAFGVLSALSIVQYFTGFPRPQQIPGTSHFHATLFLGHHLSVASVFIFPFFAALDLGSRKDARARSGLSREVLAACVGFGLLCLFFTYSRTLWIALPIGIFIWICWALPSRRRWPALAGAAGGLVVALLIPGVWQRLRDARGILPREELWLANLEFFKARPFTGVGWHHNIELSGIYLVERTHASSVFSGHAHNNLIDILAGTGLVGTFAWVAWCTLAFVLLWEPAHKGTGFARGLLCAWIVFHINGLTQVNFWEAKVLHQISWMTAWAILWRMRERA
jgi:O-antigen ligase